MDNLNIKVKSKVNQCQMCFARFNSVEEFGIHVNKVHKGHECWYPCPKPECYSVFNLRFNLNYHLKTEHPKDAEIFTCPIEECNYQTTKTNTIVRHLRELHKVNPLNYITPDRAYSSTTHDEFGAIKCTFEKCNKRFSQKDKMLLHIKKIHAGGTLEITKDFIEKTSDIGDKFENTEDLSTFTISVPPKPNSAEENVATDNNDDDGLYPCPTCTASFQFNYILKRHMATQHGVNTEYFNCPIKGCDIQMTRKDHLQKHIRTVHKVDPKECKFSKSHCINIIQQSTQRPDRQLRKSSRVNPSTCSPSPSKKKWITSTTNLRGSSSKNFKCGFEDCDTVLSRKDHLYRHIRRVHKLDPAEVLGPIKKLH